MSNEIVVAPPNNAGLRDGSSVYAKFRDEFRAVSWLNIAMSNVYLCETASIEVVDPPLYCLIQIPGLMPIGQHTHDRRAVYAAFQTDR